MLKEFIASQFKKPTGLFGIFTSNFMVKNNQKAYEMLISDMSLLKNEKILEIGYGPGVGIRMIAERCPGCTIHGIDFSELMYARAGKYNRSLIEQGRVQLQHGDFLEVPLSQNAFDKIFCLNVIYFWNKLKDPFDKVFSLLKKDASFHIFMADAALLNKRKASIRSSINIP